MEKAKKVKCAVCGNKTIAQRARTEVIGVLFNPLRYFDVMDCPKCGCEITLIERKGPSPEADAEEAPAE